MLLVFLFFIIIILAIYTSNLRIFIKTIKGKINTTVKIYIFNNIPIFKVNVQKSKKIFKKNEKIKKFFNKKIGKIKINKQNFIKIVYNVIKESNIELRYLDFNVDICTIDPIVTSYIVTIVSVVISFFLRIFNIKIKFNNCKYKINPIYINEKILNIDFNCILNIKIAHTLVIIYKNFMKRRCNINGRTTSDRRTYGNCHE